jgi:hypothetical protein
LRTEGDKAGQAFNSIPMDKFINYYVLFLGIPEYRNYIGSYGWPEFRDIDSCNYIV